MNRVFNDNNFPYFITENGDIFSEKTGKTMTPSYDKDGYPVITFEFPEKKQYRVARIVLLTFRNVPNSQHLQVRYKDKNRRNLSLDNLYWSNENDTYYEDEQWRKIELDGEVTFYSISNYGRCRNDKTNTLLKGKFNTRTGYISYKLCYRIDKYISAHRTVMKAFCPCLYMDDLQVNHIDGDKTNNKLSNLEWCTGAENVQHAVDNNLMSSYQNMIIYVYTLDGKFLEKTTPAQFEEKTQVGYHNIINCVSGRTRSVGQKYQILKTYVGEKIAPWYQKRTNKTVYVYDKDTSELVNTFDSQKACGTFYNTVPSTISRCLKLNLLLQNKYIITNEPLI